MTKYNDNQILNILRQDSRISLGAIAKRTNNSISTIYNKIDKMEDQKIIQKWTTIISPEFIRYSIEVFFHVWLKEEINDLRINNMSTLTSSKEYMIQAYFKDISDLEEFKQKIKSKGKILKTFFVYEQLKKEDIILS